jgi:hypothetical protein
MRKAAVKTCLVFSVVALSGCAAMLPSPQVEKSQGQRSLSKVVDTAESHTFFHGKYRLGQRFFKQGPGTIAVAQDLGLGSFSARARSRTAYGLASNALMAGSSAAGPGPLGVTLAILGATDTHKVYPKWANRYRWMAQDTRMGQILQVVQVYPLGPDPEKASEKAVTALGQQCLRYLSTLHAINGRLIEVNESGYDQSVRNAGRIVQHSYFVGTAEKDTQGNVAVVWWSQFSVPTLAGTILMGTGTLDTQTFRPSKLFPSPAQAMQSRYELNRIEAMPIPGSPGKGLVEATFAIQDPSRFHQSGDYRRALSFFAKDYVVTASVGKNAGQGVAVWHEGHMQDVSLPKIG